MAELPKVEPTVSSAFLLRGIKFKSLEGNLEWGLRKGDWNENEILSERDWFMGGGLNINIVANASVCRLCDCTCPRGVHY